MVHEGSWTLLFALDGLKYAAFQSGWRPIPISKAEIAENAIVLAVTCSWIRRSADGSFFMPAAHEFAACVRARPRIVIATIVDVSHDIPIDRNGKRRVK